MEKRKLTINTFEISHIFNTFFLKSLIYFSYKNGASII